MDMRKRLALVAAALVALGLPVAAVAKGFTRAVLIGSDGRPIVVRGSESLLAGMLSARGARESLAGGYVRLFFVGPGGFPAAPGRYFPARECVALDWPSYETSCRAIDSALVRLLRPARSLQRFRVPPTVLTSIRYRGVFAGAISTAAALKPDVELALDRTSRRSPRPHGCYAFTGVWRGPAAHARPKRFLLCPTGIYADERLYPLERGVWAWFRLNVV
jgi:hypothetical protein